MLDEEMKEQMKADIPEIAYLFISSLAQQGLVELKDLLWKKLNNA